MGWETGIRSREETGQTWVARTLKTGVRDVFKAGLEVDSGLKSWDWGKQWEH